MAITLGTFTQSPAGFTGSLKTLNVTAALTIVPEPGRQIERRDLCEPQTGRPRIWRELAALPPRQVKLERPAEDGATHIVLWEPRDR